MILCHQCCCFTSAWFLLLSLVFFGALRRGGEGCYTPIVNVLIILHRSFDEKLVGTDFKSDLGTLFWFHQIYMLRFLMGGGGGLSLLASFFDILLMYFCEKLVLFHQ